MRVFTHCSRRAFLESRRNASHATWGFNDIRDWEFDYKTSGELVLSTKQNQVTLSGQVISQYHGGSRQMTWGWEHPMIAPALKKFSERVRVWALRHGLFRLTEHVWWCDESEAWAMSSFAADFCGARGMFRAPYGTNCLYIAFAGKPVVHPKNSTEPENCTGATGGDSSEW